MLIAHMSPAIDPLVLIKDLIKREAAQSINPAFISNRLAKGVGGNRAPIQVKTVRVHNSRKLHTHDKKTPTKMSVWIMKEFLRTSLACLSGMANHHKYNMTPGFRVHCWDKCASLFVFSMVSPLCVLVSTMVL